MRGVATAAIAESCWSHSGMFILICSYTDCLAAVNCGAGDFSGYQGHSAAVHAGRISEIGASRNGRSARPSLVSLVSKPPILTRLISDGHCRPLAPVSGSLHGRGSGRSPLPSPQAHLPLVFNSWSSCHGLEGLGPHSALLAATCPTAPTGPTGTRSVPFAPSSRLAFHPSPVSLRSCPLPLRQN